MIDRETGARSISDAAVRAQTGKDWTEWLSILDAWGVQEKGHTQTAKYPEREYGLSRWWGQTVTLRYEWERGLRKAT